MKDRYFGDINDYFKYGLLRALTQFGRISTSICWMLTPDDGKPEGGKLDYLLRANEWREFDPKLFAKLRDIVVVEQARGVRYAQERDLIPSATYFDEILTDDQSLRDKFMQRFMRLSSGARLLFFDPDNGMEVSSVPLGRKGSSKYLYWDEVSGISSQSFSLLVYQHFPRVERQGYIDQLAARFRMETEYSNVFSFRTKHVVFFLLAAQRDLRIFEEQALVIQDSWDGQIKVSRHLDA